MTFPADPHGASAPRFGPDGEPSGDPSGDPMRDPRGEQLGERLDDPLADELGDELGDVARLLRRLEPRGPAIDEARLMFLAGQESAFAAACRHRRDLFRWRILAVVCGGVAAASLLLAFRRDGDRGVTAGSVPVAADSATKLITANSKPSAIQVPKPSPIPVPVPVPDAPSDAVSTATAAAVESVGSTTMDQVCDRALALVAARRGWRTDLRSFVDSRDSSDSRNGDAGALENSGSMSPRTTLELRQAFLRDGLRSLDQPLP